LSAALKAASTAMATDQLIARDAVIRQAAFDHVRALQSRDLTLSHEEIARGFMFEGQRWPLWNPQRGIFEGGMRIDEVELADLLSTR
jgi:hypothetical protein